MYKMNMACGEIRESQGESSMEFLILLSFQARLQENGLNGLKWGSNFSKLFWLPSVKGFILKGSKFFSLEQKKEFAPKDLLKKSVL